MWRVNGGGGGHNPLGPRGAVSGRCPGLRLQRRGLRGPQRKLLWPGRQGGAGCGLCGSRLHVPPKRQLARGAEDPGRRVQSPVASVKCADPAQGTSLEHARRCRFTPCALRCGACPHSRPGGHLGVGHPCPPHGGPARRCCSLILQRDFPLCPQTSTPVGPVSCPTTGLLPSERRAVS